MIFQTLKRQAETFTRSESGAVTVDWVVLTAAAVGLAIAVLTQVASGATEMSADVKRCTRIIGNQVLRDQATDNRSWGWRLERAQRNCGRIQ